MAAARSRVPRGRRAGFSLALGIALVVCSPACATRLPGVFRYHVLEDRSTTVPVPIAPPPPPAADTRRLDVAARQSLATWTQGSADVREGASGLDALLTDGALTVRPTRYVGVRVLGGIGYGPTYGLSQPTVDFASSPTGSFGIGVIAGSWDAAERWSITVEVDTRLVLAMSRDRYREEIGPCFEDPFGGVTCGPGTPTGVVSFPEGVSFAPTASGGVDGSYQVSDWLRVGGGVAVQALVTRTFDGGLVWAPVGLGRLFAEATIDDVSTWIEVQQPVAENVVFAPVVSIGIRARFFPRRPRRSAQSTTPARGAAGLGSPVAAPLEAAGRP